MHRRTVNMKPRGQRRGRKPVQDVMVINNGTTQSLMALTTKAKEWCKQHLPEDCPMMGTFVYVVESRCAPDILQGMQNDGLAL